MIAVDTSAVVAIALNEPERPAFRDAILQAGKALISTASVLETKMVLYGRRGPRAVILADDLFRLPIFEIVPPGPADLEAAFGAFVVFGKGSGHPAQLNYGDLFAYALAKVRDLPLLFKGADFIETDLVQVVMPQVGVPQVGVPQVAVTQVAVTQAGAPQAGVPQVGVPQGGPHPQV
jgi:ribonuclease VapC